MAQQWQPGNGKYITKDFTIGCQEVVWMYNR